VGQVQRELSLAACFALASLQENAPLALSEAMAAGVPAAATRVGGVPEMVEPGASGWLVGAGEPRALGEALASLLADEPRARAMGRRARELARRHHAAAVARATADVYREIASE
jgi:glycosyltransferase involved in cell wall biosynthesis